MRPCRLEFGVSPSMRSVLTPFIPRKSAKSDSIPLNCEKISTLCSGSVLSSITFKYCSFAEGVRKSSKVYGIGRSIWEQSFLLLKLSVQYSLPSKSVWLTINLIRIKMLLTDREPVCLPRSKATSSSMLFRTIILARSFCC